MGQRNDHDGFNRLKRLLGQRTCLDHLQAAAADEIEHLRSRRDSIDEEAFEYAEQIERIKTDHAALCEAVREWERARDSGARLGLYSPTEKRQAAYDRFIAAEKHMLALANQ